MPSSNDGRRDRYFNANPLIRCRCRDVSFLYDSAVCDCGRTHQRYKEIVGRTDDMVRISGANFWPSEVESVLLRTEMVGPEYRIRLSKVNFTDKVKIEVESASKMGDKESKDKLSRELASELHNTLLFTPEVEILDPIPCPESRWVRRSACWTKGRRREVRGRPCL